jgi:prephenate dehydrogenase
LKLAIIGPGLIGTSVALAARRAWPDVELIEVDRHDSVATARGADVIVLATPVDTIIQILRDESQHFGAALVLDAGSTKRAIVAAAHESGVENFVGGHPMAGAARSGPSAARADLFDGRPWFLIRPGERRGPLARAQAFVEALGATAVVLDDDGREHDRIMAAVSHLPQVVASVLMTVVGTAAGEHGLEWAGTGLRDTTRLAASDAAVWESILATNAVELRPLLLELADKLLQTADELDDAAAVRQLFAMANRYRAIVNVDR